MTLEEAILEIKTKKRSQWSFEAARLVDLENNRLIKEAFELLPVEIRLKFATIAFDTLRMHGWGDCRDPFIEAGVKIPDCVES